MKNLMLVLMVLLPPVLAAGNDPCAPASEESRRAEASGKRLTKGWVIGNDAGGTAVILHTRNGGKTWRAQGDNTRWTGYWGNDISAVDGQTAWAALGSPEGGKILHTRNGGARWVEQELPEGGQIAVEQFNPPGRHILEGITCSDDLHAVVVGSKAVGADHSLPAGVILATEDGGVTWTNQSTPEDDVAFWKVSFAGARR